MQVHGKFGYPATRGPRIGHCNICDVHGVLTEDHVPPKGTIAVPQIDLIHIVELLSAERPIGRKRARHFQNGVKFRSLCGRCNNALLGATYDPALIEFSNSTALLLKSSLAIPDVANVTITPGLVARSVLGHLFAIGVERRERSPPLSAAATFFADASAPLPDEVEIYYWVYPYRRQIAIRDGALMTDFFKAPPLIFWCLKYFPLGFMITFGNANPRRVNLPNLRDYMINAGVHPATVPLPLRQIPRPDWPEAPDGSGAVLYGDGAVGALPRSSG